MPILTAPAITEERVAAATYAILHEWLASYFDGGAHPVGTNPAVTFPQVHLAFGEGQQTEQPLGRPEIRVILASRTERRFWVSAGWRVIASVQLNFWIKFKGREKDALGNAKKQVMAVADLLKYTLTNLEARRSLAQKGIFHLNPRIGQEVQSPDHVVTVVNCPCQLQYESKF